ncbi:VTT domain-containing protein [Halorubellus sp. PRR65]|uniref:DedA family protein n=1 Tax=Halorubellus sp. PRR65 TaxID=3098148 RepID=UPI002B262EAE|nr:VTT domain-containing protein [Halorubellus sp. PRR65]
MTTDVADGTQPRDDGLRWLLAEYGPLAVAVGFALLAAAGVALFLVGDESLARAYLDRYGMVALFAILVLEGAMLLYFAPSEALVPASIQLLAASTGDLRTIAALVLVAAAGATVGQYALFTLAKRTGRDWLLERTWFRVSESRLARFEGWFDRWGRAAVLLSNALLFTRGMLTVPAGFADMDDVEFVALSAVGSVLFQTWLALAWLGVLELGAL